MNKEVTACLLSAAISTGAFGESSNKEVDFGIDDTSFRVSSLLTSNNLPKPKFLELLESSYGQCDVVSKDVERNILFPREVQTIGLDRMAEGFLGNIKYDGLNVIHPPLVDIGWFERVYCAGTMRGFLAYSKNNDDRSTEEISYINKQGVDAWMLPDELKKLGYDSRFNLTLFFDKNKIGQPDIVGNRELYRNSLIDVGNYLKEEGVPGSMLFIYFNLSNYTWVVKDFNEDRISGISNYSPNINTHQAMYLGNSFMQFTASEIKSINRGGFSEFKEGTDSINFIANFVQQRGGYKSALNDRTRNIIIDNIKHFYGLIDFEVNGVKIDVLEEHSKSESERLKISSQDIIKLSGPILIDGFHDANSPNKYISENNHVRTMFYFEFVSIGSYTPSELLVPSNEYLERKTQPNVYNQITDSLEITNVYYLKENETINLKLREAILRYKFGKGNMLSYSDDEVELMNKIQSVKKGTRERLSYIFKLNNLREQKINSLFDNLSSQQKAEFNREYQNQIYGLQMMGYLQDEGNLNDLAVKINAPIPFFNTNGMYNTFMNYVENKKDDLMNYYTQKNVNVFDDDCVNIFFYPGDNIATIFSQLEQKLKVFSESYPNFKKIGNLDILKRYKLLDLVVDKYSGEYDIDLTNQVIPSMRNLDIPLDLIDRVLDELLNESYIKNVDVLSDLDSDMMNIISDGNKQDYDLLTHILAHESYENGFPRRKFAKITADYFSDTFISNFINLKTSSAGDFQTRLENLLNRNNSLINWPSADHIKKAISHIENPELLRIIERRAGRFEEGISKDLKIVEEIKEMLEYLDYYTDEQKLEFGRKIYDKLIELFKYNDSRQLNIVGKIIQSSLVLDKMHGHYYNLNGWLLNSGVSIDEILYNENLLERYKKLLLTINNRSERTTLIGTGESYVLRIFEALGDDIRGSDYPLLKKNWKDQISYDRIPGVLDERFTFYIEKINSIEGNDDIREELLYELNNLLKTNFSALEIYKFFRNPTIRAFLDENGFDSYFIPTIEEFSNTGFRELLFDYAKSPSGRTPPKIRDYEKIILASITGIIGTFIGVTSGGIYFIRRIIRRRQKK